MKILRRSLLFVGAIVLISNVTQSQEQLKHEKKFYLSPEGKLYVNKSLPIYFRIATSADENAKSYLLSPNKDSKKYANPMYFDTEGYNTFRSPSKVDTITKKVIYPLQDIIYEVYSDSKAPITSFFFENKKYFKKEGFYYFNENIILSFNIKDVTSGVDESYYSINNSGYKKLAEKLELNEEKLYEIKFYSVDYVGNVESPKSINIKIDFTKPETKLSANPDVYNDILSPRSRISLEAKDENSGVKKTVFSIDEGKYYNYIRPIVISALKEGEHTLSYYSIDNINNEETKKVYSFYLDKSPPMIVDELQGNTFIANGKEYSSGRSMVKFTAMDNKAGVREIRYSINDGEFIEYTGPFYLSKSGKLKVKTFVTDNVNNQSINTIMTNKANVSYVDLSGPTLGHSFEGAKFISKDTAFITNDTKIKLAAKDNASGHKRIEYSIDNGDLNEYNNSFSIDNEGIHTITYTGYDNVDNTSTNSFICVEDNIGPKIFFRFSILSGKVRNMDGKDYNVFPNHVVLFLSATDESVGFHKMLYSINDLPNKEYTSLVTGFQAGKLYNIKVTAIDKLGNKSQETIEFYVE